MRTLAINTFLTLNGVMQAPGGPEEDPTGGFTHGGWSVKYWDEAMVRRIGDSMRKPFELLLGRRTYEIFAAHWPSVRDVTGSPGNRAPCLRPRNSAGGVDDSGLPSRPDLGKRRCGWRPCRRSQPRRPEAMVMTAPLRSLRLQSPRYSGSR